MTEPIVPVNPVGPTLVCEMVSGYSLTLNEDGQSGTRKFVTASFFPNQVSIELPELGDSWSDDYPNLRLNNIQVNYLNDNDNCPFIYTCSYTVRPDTFTVWAAEDDLPTSISCGPEFVSLPIKSGNWSWLSDGAKLSDTTSIFKNTTVMNIAIRRTIKDLKQFISESVKVHGKLNDKDFYGLPMGQVMYVGFDAEETRTPYLNSRRWNITLNFSVRRVPKDNDNNPTTSYKGWNYILREDTGFFDAPLNVIDFLYETGNFDNLMTVAAVTGDLGIIIPTKP